MNLFDCFLFFNELDLLEKRLELLNDVVDFFVIVESTKTFSGNAKPLFFQENRQRFQKFENKILYFTVTEDYDATVPEDLINYFTNKNSQYPHKHKNKKFESLHPTVKREIFQRDSIIIALQGQAEANDIILLSDLDEFPNPLAVAKLKNNFEPNIIYHFKQDWFSYGINCLCTNEWFGTRAFEFSKLKFRSIDYFRYPTESRTCQDGIIVEDGGWHFSYFGDEATIASKLDSLAFQGLRVQLQKILGSLLPNYFRNIVTNRRDILGKRRCFKIIKPEEVLPTELTKDLDFLKKYSL